jgi:hypothetical protein
MKMGLMVPAPPDELDEFFAQQCRRIGTVLGRVDSRIKQRRKADLTEAYADAEALTRLAQIATNAGRTVLPGLEQYDSVEHSPVGGSLGHPWPVDREAAVRRKYAVAWGGQRQKGR